MTSRLNGKWVPVRTACRILGVSKQRVHELIRSGQLTWCKMDLTVMVGRDSVLRRKAAKEEASAS